MMNMQFNDLKAQYIALKPEIDMAIQTVIDEGQFISGRQVAELEDLIAECIGVPHVIACANGTDALLMLYMAYGVKAGDAVFCTDLTFVASVEPAILLGATPVFCDVLPGVFNIDPDNLEKQVISVINEGRLNPKAVVAIDFLGNPAEYDAIAAICKKYGLKLIEDAAQGFGASKKGGMCGAFGDGAITSFFPAKPLGCYGDGGAIMTGDARVADMCRSMRVHGRGASKYDNVIVGMNSRLDTIQAAILQVKLKALVDYEIDRRQKIAMRYTAALKDSYELQRVAGDAVSVYAQYVLLAKDSVTRDRIAVTLKDKGIPSMVYYPNPMHKLKVFDGVNLYGESFPMSTDYCMRTLSIPMHPYLGEEQQEYIIDALLEAV